MKLSHRLERATAQAGATLAGMLDEGADGDEPTPTVRGVWQKKIAPLAGFLSARGLTAAEIAKQVGYDEANTYTVLASLEKTVWNRSMPAHPSAGVWWISIGATWFSTRAT